jgi:hypothetical protein
MSRSYFVGVLLAAAVAQAAACGGGGLDFGQVFGSPAFGTAPAFVWGDDTGAVFVVGQDPGGTQGLIARSTDFGGSWGTSTVAQVPRFTGVWGASALDVWVIGDGVVVHATDGQHFQSVTALAGKSWAGVFGVDATHVFFIEAGNLWTFDGATFGRIGPITTATETSVFALDASSVFITDTAGELWTVQGSNATGAVVGGGGSLRTVGGSVAAGLFVAADGGPLFHLAGGGAAPVSIPGFHFDVRSIWAATDGTAYLVGDDGLHITSNAGASFVDQSSPRATSIWGTRGGVVWAVGGGAIYQATR